MGDRSRSTRILCVNCNICVNTLRRYLALTLDPTVSSVICGWVYPLIITEEDYVCEACRDLAMLSVNQCLQPEVSGSSNQHARPSHRGHTHVCLLCGCSILHRQSDRILRDTPTDLQRSIRSVIENRVAPRQITETDRVCHACWLRTQREVRRTSIIDDARSYQKIPEDTLPSEPVSSDKQLPNGVIELPEYRRAANTNSHCVFPHCSSTKLRGTTDKLRAIVLSNHHYYLPELTRVCDKHLECNMWDTLFESDNSIATFTIRQIQHIFSFVNACDPTLDFENIDEFDERVFVSWVGYTKKKFRTIVEEVPRVNKIRKGSLGLAMLLLKMRTGDSNERIATIIGMPRRTLEVLMNKIRVVLLQDFVPSNRLIPQIPLTDPLRRELVDFLTTNSLKTNMQGLSEQKAYKSPQIIFNFSFFN